MSNKKPPSEVNLLKLRIKELEKENEKLRNQKKAFYTTNATVSTPKNVKPLFDKAEETVRKYFDNFKTNPSKAKIEINKQRYILLRAPALSYEFLKNIVKLYSDRGEAEAIKIGRNLLFDMAHLIGIEDAKNFHKEMKLKDPIEKMSAGPVHFAYSGWAFVEILKESRPSPDENFFLKYNHPYSFEADSWIKAGEKSKFPVCSMNSGYSSGWCEKSFGIELTSVEITCKARGDENCTFIMAPPHKINSYLQKEKQVKKKNSSYDIPLFFERKKVEEKMNNSLKEKETLLKEIHHRVKNNLQIISSLLNLQSENIIDPHFLTLIKESRDRIRSMALVHEMLYASKDLNLIGMHDYFVALVDMLYLSYGKSKSDIEFKINIDSNLLFEIDKMINIGLIVTEIISNSLKYAFPDNKGVISISYKDKILQISDNGIGYKKKNPAMKSSTLGMQLIFMLSDQMDCKVSHTTDNGVCYGISC